MRELRRFHTAGFHPTACRLSPYTPGLMATALAQNYGLKGNGRMLIVDNAGRQYSYDFKDACFDVSFLQANNLLVCSGDGFFYCLSLGQQGVQMQGRSVAGHSKECISVDCNADFVASAGWDGAILVFNHQLRLIQKRSSVHKGSCHQVVWHPRLSELYCSSGGDGHIIISDVRSSKIASINTQSHPDVLSIDWCKYKENTIACGTADGVIKIYDIRVLQSPTSTLKGHKRAIKRLQYSPFNQSSLISVSYDMSVVHWDTDTQIAFARSTEFSEFVIGLDHSVFNPKEFIVCSWDETVRTFTL